MRKSNTEEFIKKAKFIHGNKYDYSLVQYLNNKTKVEIICNIEGHKNFMQTPDAHINIGNGCPECKKCKLSYSTDTFIKKANKVHSNYYTYQSTVYTLAGNAVTVTCPVHGDFSVRANQHLAGQICMKCDIANKTKSVEEYLLEAAAIHNDKYDYSLVNYINSFIKVEILCKNCNNFFLQSPYSHLNGHGCSKCNLGSLTGWSKTQWINFCNLENREPVLYIIRCFNEIENFIKIGRTSKTTYLRFNTKQTMPYSYEVIKEIKGSPDFIYDKEYELHNLYKKYRYKPLIPFGGQTECFDISILEFFK